MSEKKICRLCENWYIDKDPDNNGREKGWDVRISEAAVGTKIPSIIQEAFPDCHGVVFYWNRFVPEINCEEHDRLLLCFGAADYKADVYLNGEYIGSHEGGETPFQFDVTDKVKIKEENLLSVRLVNPVVEDIDGLNIVNIPNRNKMPKMTAGSCSNHGGLWGEVDLVCLPALYLEDVFLTGDIHTGELTAKVSIQNTQRDEAPASLEVNVYSRYGVKEKAAGEKVSLLAKDGYSENIISVIVPDVKLWDIDDPNLYRVEVSINSEYGSHTKLETFGFRELLIKDGYFYLNDRKIFLKNSHTGNAFPVGQGYPAIKEQIRKDMIMAKSYGFNMVRAIAGMLRTEQLEAADEIGLMIYEESYAGWNLGNGSFLPGKGLDKIGDEEKMLERFDNSVIEMIKRDRNHPSVTIWGLLNEMSDQFPVTKHAREFLPKLRKMDPSRLVFFNSGRWDQYKEIASASNPYSDTWNAAMGSDLLFEDDDSDIKRDGVSGNMGIDSGGDLHIYPEYPLKDSYISYVRNYAKGYKPAYFSETGMSSIFNVIEEAKHYEQYGYRKDLEDYVLIKNQAQQLELDWERLGLKKVYPYAEMMLKESQRLSAEDRRRIFNAVRSNPQFGGYSLTGLLDHGWCGEGLWSLWRRFKPEVYDAVCDGWAPLRFCLFAGTHVYSSEEFEIEAVLANECVLKKGTYTADFAVTGDEGTIMMWSESFEIKDDSFAVPVMKKRIRLDVKSGKYSLIAYMKDASPLGNKLDFYVTDRKEINADAVIAVCGLKESTVKFLEEMGVQTKGFSGQTEGLILAGKVNAEEVIALHKAAENGARVFFIDCEAFYGENSDNIRLLKLADEITVKENQEWLYHKESVMANREVFKGLGSGLMDPKRFGQVISMKCIETAINPDDVVCPAFYTGYYAYDGSYACVHNVLGVNCNKGRIYISTLGIEENLGKEPAADILLKNIVEYLK
ncbi:MAG: hypothetical protein IKC46_12810 [Lachnospiraceae bacterium]|nr:hypothetical protein [Lachnospiraceae bacterium]